MTVEQLRQQILRGIDEALDRPLISRFLTGEQKRLLRATRRYWLEDDGAQLARLSSLLDQEPMRFEDVVADHENGGEG